MQGYYKESAVSNKQILFYTNPAISVGIVASNDGIEANEEGKKIIKAGTPMAGKLTERATAFTKTNTNTAVGVLLHDVDVTLGNNNATLLIDGFVNLNRLDSDVATMITDDVITAIPHVRFLK
jgi:hypothetical protein